MNAPSLSSQARSLIEMKLEVGAYATDWRHCDQVANYLARAVSFDRSDTFFHSNLLSTVLNELLEIVFHQHTQSGHLLCTLLRDGGIDRIQLNIAVNDSTRLFYRESVNDAQSTNVAELYTRSLLEESESDASIGFLELAADYGAKIWLDESSPNGDIQLTVDVQLEGEPIACL